MRSGAPIWSPANTVGNLCVCNSFDSRKSRYTCWAGAPRGRLQGINFPFPKKCSKSFLDRHAGIKLHAPRGRGVPQRTYERCSPMSISVRNSSQTVEQHRSRPRSGVRVIEYGRRAAPVEPSLPGYARCVGRVGALAIALGVGAAIASMPVAFATTGSEGSSGSRLRTVRRRRRARRVAVRGMASAGGSSAGDASAGGAAGSTGSAAGAGASGSGSGDGSAGGSSTGDGSSTGAAGSTGSSGGRRRVGSAVRRMARRAVPRPVMAPRPGRLARRRDRLAGARVLDGTILWRPRRRPWLVG